MSIENGKLNTTKTTYGTVAEVTCEIGYKTTGNNLATCLETGSWSDKPRCEILGTINLVMHIKILKTPFILQIFLVA